MTFGRSAALALCALVLACSGCGSSSASGKPPGAPFGSAASPAAPAEVWAVGDGGIDTRRAHSVADRIAAARPARVLYLGDVYPDGTSDDFEDNFAPVYGALTRLTSPTPGNHEWPTHAQGYDPFWQKVSGRPPPAHYAFRIGGWQVVSLNSETPDDPGQLRWLRDLLSRTSGTCTIAFWHRPRFSAGAHGDQVDTSPLWNAVRGRARLVLNGHDHDMQRLRAIGGTTEYVSGAGGHDRYLVNDDDPRLAFSADDTEGALRLQLRPGAASLAFIAADGRTLDTSSVHCRPAS
jgi:hypothetical protein